jgi:hypothetical protein
MGAVTPMQDCLQVLKEPAEAPAFEIANRQNRREAEWQISPVS